MIDGNHNGFINRQNAYINRNGAKRKNLLRTCLTSTFRLSKFPIERVGKSTYVLIEDQNRIVCPVFFSFFLIQLVSYCNSASRYIVFLSFSLSADVMHFHWSMSISLSYPIISRKREREREKERLDYSHDRFLFYHT